MVKLKAYNHLNRKYYFFIYAIIIGTIGCGKDETIKRFKLTDFEPINVSDQIIDFETDQLIAIPVLTIMDDLLIVKDGSGLSNNFIHLFEKNTLKHLNSVGLLGEGPGEFMNSGQITVGYNPNEFWLAENSKMKMFKFDKDSALVDKNYKPSISKPMGNDFFLSRFQFMSDSLAIGAGIEVLSTNTFRVRLGIWNLNQGSTSKFGYEHPKLTNERTNAFFSYSKAHQMFALAYSSHDIMSILSLDGGLKFNIIGEKEFDNDNRRIGFFDRVHIDSNQIIALYLSDERFVIKDGAAPRGKGATKLLFFDLEGNLQKIIETGHEIYNFAVDEENNRVFCYFIDREIPIGYFKYK